MKTGKNTVEFPFLQLSHDNSPIHNIKTLQKYNNEMMLQKYTVLILQLTVKKDDTITINRLSENKIKLMEANENKMKCV